MGGDLDVRPVADDQWDVVAWLFQAFRNDLAPVVEGLPRADGRYNHRLLDAYPAPDRAGWLAWRPHPNDGRDAPVGLALVDGLGGERRHLAAFWVAPAARRGGLGLRLALDVLGRHPGPWAIGFQADNAAAGAFWRRVATSAYGDGWVEEQRAVPRRPDVPPDHWILAPPTPG